jgi:hypothetical protein
MTKEIIIAETIRANNSMNELLKLVCISDSPDVFIFNEHLKEHIEHIRKIHEAVKVEISQYVPA